MPGQPPSRPPPAPPGRSYARRAPPQSQANTAGQAAGQVSRGLMSVFNTAPASSPAAPPTLGIHIRPARPLASNGSGAAGATASGPAAATGSVPLRLFRRSPVSSSAIRVSGVGSASSAGPAQSNSTPSDRWSFDLVDPGRSASIYKPRQAKPKKDGTVHLARRTAALRRSRNALDVRLVFPRQTGHDLNLWSNSALLKDASPYFTTLLESDFAETFTTSSSKRRRVDSSEASSSKGKEKELSAGPERELEPREFDDSDDEADEAIAAHFPEPANDDSSALYYEIVLPQACYITFEAVLSYVTTGYIEFAPLSSIVSADERSVTRAIRLADNPLLPLPASPKSVYRLAHLLELPDLEALALADIDKQLTAESGAQVLFSDVSLAYDAVKEMALGYAAKHWNAVQKSEGMQEVQKQVEENEAPEFGKLAFELLMKVGKGQQQQQPDQARQSRNTDQRLSGILFDSSSDEHSEELAYHNPRTIARQVAGAGGQS